ncbi:MAG: urease accessory protein [Gammaproteobacteria bacterium]|jgi:urease accessory protein
MADFISQTIAKSGDWNDAIDHCVLTYDDRFLRRKVITLASGKSVLVDLAHTISLDHGDALVLNDGGCIEVIAAQEPLLEVSGDLVQLAWHIGNRHTPCQIETGFLLIQDDPVIGHMLDHLGAKISKVTAPFTPEGGAYGHGRTHSHDHGHTAHDH